MILVQRSGRDLVQGPESVVGGDEPGDVVEGHLLGRRVDGDLAEVRGVLRE